MFETSSSRVAGGRRARRHRGVVLAFLAPRSPKREVAADLLAEIGSARARRARQGTNARLQPGVVLDDLGRDVS
jgi:hypothetical protein